jgi:hypothetical protein
VSKVEESNSERWKMIIREKLSFNHPTLTIGVLGALKIGVKRKRIIRRAEEMLEVEACQEREKENKTSRNVMAHGQIPDNKNTSCKRTHVFI